MKHIVIISATLGLGTIVYLLSVIQTRYIRSEIERSQGNLATLKNEIVTARTSNKAAERRISQFEKEARAAAEKLPSETGLAGAGINDIWSSPPKALPELNLESPYIWLDKEVLPKLPLQTIGKEGEITKEIAEILGVSRAQLDRVNQKLVEIVAENRTLAQNSAEIVHEDVLSTGSSDGTKISVKIQVPTEATEQLKDRYQSAISDEVGEDRKDLLCRSVATQSWLNTEFGVKPEIISVVRHPNGTYNIGFKERGSSFGGITKLEDYLPDFVLPLFDSIRNKTD